MEVKQVLQILLSFIHKKISVIIWIECLHMTCNKKVKFDVSSLDDWVIVILFIY